LPREGRSLHRAGFKRGKRFGKNAHLNNAHILKTA
jgi:hypothetical protein